MQGSDGEISAWLDLTRQVAQQLDEKTNVIETFWKDQLRSDGRVFSETRPYTVTHSLLPDAAGSALVQVNGTVILAVVTVAVGQSVAASGDCIVQVESSCPSFQQQFEMQSFLQRTLDENLEFGQLSIDTHWAFRLQVHIQVLDTAGSCLDVALAATSACLLSTAIPLSFDSTTSTVSAETRPFQMSVVPCALSAVLYDNVHYIVDPTTVEEEAGNNLLATVMVDAANPEVILAVQGPVLPPLLDLATGHAKQLYTILQPRG